MALSPNVAAAYGYLVNRGMQPLAAAAMVGGLMQESYGTLDTGAVGDNGESFGIMQARGPRAAALRAYQDPNAKTELERQLSFLMHELATTEKGAGKRLGAATDLPGAAKAAIGYERPRGYTLAAPEQGDAYAERLANAQTVYSALGNGAVSPASAPTYDLSGHLVAGKDKSILQGVGSNLSTRFGQLVANAPPEIRKQLQILSAYRSKEHQQRLWDASDKSGKMVARPGRSQHEHGNALDLRYASPEAKAYAHANAAKYGLTFPMSYEPWHIETVEARGGAPFQGGNTTMAGVTPSSLPQGAPGALPEAPAPPPDPLVASVQEAVTAITGPPQAAAPDAAPAPQAPIAPVAAPQQEVLAPPDSGGAANLMAAVLDNQKLKRIPGLLEGAFG